MYRRKVQLRRVVLRPKDKGILVHKFGGKKSGLRVGTVGAVGPYTVEVSFKDDEGNYLERYSLVSGVRTLDIGNTVGWKIDLTEIHIPTRLFRPLPPKGSHIRKVWEEEHEINSLEVLVWTVWEDTKFGVQYLKVTRRRQVCVEGDQEQVPKVREYPGLIPLSKVLELLDTLKERKDER